MFKKKKGQPTLVTQVYLILQNRREFKALVTVGLNSLSSCRDLLWHITLFTIPHFFSENLVSLC